MCLLALHEYKHPLILKVGKYSNFVLPFPSQAAISHQQDDFQLLVLAVVQRAVVQREVISGFKALQVEKFSPLYSVLNLTVTPLCKDLSWLQSPTKEQSFCWGIVASFCQSFPITNKHFEWVHSYAPVITCLGSIYISYCKWKKLPEDKCLLSADEYPQEIVHSEHIKKYGVNLPLLWCIYRSVPQIRPPLLQP